jgi:Heparinase II/III-like protein/Heparinase II/III N-terminus
MGLREIVGRLRDQAIKATWRRLKARPAVLPDRSRGSFTELALAAEDLALEPGVAGRLIAEAERLLAGRLTLFRRDVPLPATRHDWFVDSDTGRLAPMDDYAFDIDARDTAIVGNHKFLLEPSRLQHATLLGAAYFVSERDDFARLAAAQLGSWWSSNPFLSGVHWTSGIEVGLRLVSLAWTRRLLGRWPGAADCFEGSALARDQIYRHQQYLARLRSHGSSANNHLIAELLGLYVGAVAFPWFAESAGWAATAAAGLEDAARRQVFEDGTSREQASEYHGFVLELLMTAAIEGLLAGRLFSAPFHRAIAGMADAWAASLDTRCRPPRQGDSDDAFVLTVDPPDRRTRPTSLLAAAAAIVGASHWWPSTEPDLRSRLFESLCRRQPLPRPTGATRPARRPNLLPQAGCALLRDLDGRDDALWCRCDHGPHGYLSIAAHAHADALSVELRHSGVDILADPGTYCYMTEPAARRYFRSTIGHNTLEIGRVDQAEFGGPFLWLSAPCAHLVASAGLDGGDIARWTARHDGYARRPGRPVHERTVVLDRVQRKIEIEDRILGDGRFPVRLAFHLGPDVNSSDVSDVVELDWHGAGHGRRAWLRLPAMLSWRSYRGSSSPMLGWYSPAFGERVPSTSWIGEGELAVGEILRTSLDFVQPPGPG